MRSIPAILGWITSSWWLNQPLWKICSSNWTSSQIFGVKNKNIWVATTQSLFFAPFFSHISHIIPGVIFWQAYSSTTMRALEWHNPTPPWMIPNDCSSARTRWSRSMQGNLGFAAEKHDGWKSVKTYIHPTQDASHKWRFMGIPYLKMENKGKRWLSLGGGVVPIYSPNGWDS